MPEQVAGTEFYVYHLAKSHLNQGDWPIILKPNYSIKEERQFDFEGIQVIEYPESNVLSKELITGFVYPSGVSSFKKILERVRPDVIHFHEISGSNGITIGHIEAAKSLQIPIFLTMHLATYSCKTGNLFYKQKTRCDGQIIIERCTKCALNKRGVPDIIDTFIMKMGRLFFKNQYSALHSGDVRSLFNYSSYIKQLESNLTVIFEKCEKIFVLSEWYKNVLILNQAQAEKLVLLPKVYPPKVAYSVTKKVYPNNVIRLVYVGRITKIKGLYTLIKALGLITKENWELTIFGQIDDQVYYEKCKRKSESICDRISWKGIVPHEEIVNTLSEFDLLIFPSEIEEMSPLIIQEAFAAGLPVLASNLRSVSDIIQHDINGFIFNVGDHLSLKQALETVLVFPNKLLDLNLSYKEVSFDDISHIQKDYYTR